MKTLTSKLLLAFLALCSVGRGADFLIHDGDRVVFLGDSITEQRLYTTYIEAYVLTREPGWKLSFRNVGWGGDTSWLRQRAHPDEAKLFAADDASQKEMIEKAVENGLARDVFPLKPTFVTVNFGMNDHSYQAFREDIFKAYVRSQTEIAKLLKVHAARVAFLTPQPIEEKRPDPDQDVRNQSLWRFSDGLRQVAADTGSAFVDQFDPYMTMLLRERPQHPNSCVGGGDAVHPGPIGHTVMAWAILKGLGAAALVSSAEIDYATKTATTQRCKISVLNVSPGTIRFDRDDDALPMPIDEKAQEALKLAPILEDLDRYELRVTGLPTGTYELTIDSESVGKAASEELARGWNLATQAGPITRQAQHILNLVVQKNNLYYTRWRMVQLYSFPDWAKGPENEKLRAEQLRKLDAEIEDAESSINQARKPLIHHFELRPEAK